ALVLCALFLQINPFAICAMAALIVLHEITVYIDLRYASTTRVITPKNRWCIACSRWRLSWALPSSASLIRARLLHSLTAKAAFCPYTVSPRCSR
ncbi:hypothetical protein QCE48_17200, partial [Caballeronia sp. LZ024]|nr:hypothetical protein [Caballeronia sp. LZ024]